MKLAGFSLLGALWLTSFQATAAFQPEIGKVLPELSIAGAHGGIVKNGAAWDSTSMRGTLNFLVYVDPDDSTLNDPLIDRLHAEKFPEQLFHSVAIINMAATWKPNAIIMSVLRGKQEKFPRTTYVFDKDRFVAQNWNLTPEGYHVLLVDADGSILFEKAGKLENNEIDKFVDLIKLKIKSAAEVRIAKPETDVEGAQKTKKSL